MRLLTLIFVILVSFDSFAFPLGLKGSEQTTPIYPVNIQAPNNQVTSLAGGDGLIETGNNNILSNGSFEHSTLTSGWTLTTVTADPETTEVIEGKKSAEITTSSTTGSICQDSTLYAGAFADNPNGKASIWVKNTATDAQVCARQGGVSVACEPILTNDKWTEYSIPFVMGSTSNGICVEFDSSTGVTYLDDAKVLKGSSELDLSPVGKWVDYGEITITATTTNPTKATTREQDNVRCRTVGEDYECEYRYRADSATGSAAGSGGYLFHLPNGVEFGDSQSVATISTATGASNDAYESSRVQSRIGSGVVGSIGSAGSYGTGYAYAVSGNRFQVCQLNGLTNGGCFASLYFALNSSNLAFSFTLKFKGKATGASSKIIQDQCKNPIDCETVFSAKVSSTGVVSDENLDWIDGNCSGSTPYTCTFISGVFGVAPNCVTAPSIDPGSSISATPSTVSSSSVIVTTDNTAGAANLPFNITCQKQGSDYLKAARRTIVGEFKASSINGGNDFGIGRKMKTCQYAFGGASATLASPTVCAASPCVEVFDSCDAGTAPTRSATGTYRDITFSNGLWKPSTVLKCSCSAFQSTAGGDRECNHFFDTSDQTWITNTNGGAVLNYTSSTTSGTLSDTYIIISCTGEAP
jgi:hypothetical protein